MVERARQRAENLDKMCADTSPLKKRHSDECEINELPDEGISTVFDYFIP